MLAFKIRPQFEWPEYTIAYPSQFYSLIEFKTPKYVRGLLSKCHKSKKFIHLLGNSKSKSLTDFRAFRRDTSKFVRGVLYSTSESVDCYYTPNEFFSWPRESNLALLSANWIEIDLNNKCDPYDVRRTEAKIVPEVFNRLKLNKLPPPTGYVLSGSGGIHLYWIYNPVDAVAINKLIWQQITKSLIESFGKSDSFWHIDLMATKRISGFLRVPGSVHSRTGLHARYFGSGTKYTFDELLMCLDLCHLRKNIEKSQLEFKTSLASSPRNNIAKQPKQPKQPSHQRYGHSIKEWWLKCINSIQNHFYKQGGVPKGKRDKTAFILFVAFQHLNKNTAFEKLTKINDELIGLSLEELVSLTRTAKTTHYKYRKETLADYLKDLFGFCPEYLNIKSKVKLSSDEIKERQKKAATDTAIKKRSNSQQLVKKAVKKITKETGNRPTQQAVALFTNLSLRTVKRYWVT